MTGAGLHDGGLHTREDLLDRVALYLGRLIYRPHTRDQGRVRSLLLAAHAEDVQASALCRHD